MKLIEIEIIIERCRLIASKGFWPFDGKVSAEIMADYILEEIEQGYTANATYSDGASEE